MSTGVFESSADMRQRVVAPTAHEPGAPPTRLEVRDDHRCEPARAQVPGRRTSGWWQTVPMPVVRETQLPGVGVKHDFTAGDGREIGVLAHRDGRRDIVVYDADDPDSCSMQLSLSAEDTRTVAELLGTSQVISAVEAVQQEIEGLTMEWITMSPTSPIASRTIGDGAFRTRTGVSIIAVIRDGQSIPAPGPDQQLLAGDVVVAVGTIDGLDQVRDLITSSTT